jgi:hypothetical protein
VILGDGARLALARRAGADVERPGATDDELAAVAAEPVRPVGRRAELARVDLAEAGKKSF